MKKIRSRAAKYRYTYLNASFVVKACVIALLWYWSYECYRVVENIEPMKTFIPHELLGVEQDATKA